MNSFSPKLAFVWIFYHSCSLHGHGQVWGTVASTGRLQASSQWRWGEQKVVLTTLGHLPQAPGENLDEGGTEPVA